MSNSLEGYRLYQIKIYEKKSGRYYLFSVCAETKAKAIKLVENEAYNWIGYTCIVKKCSKLPNKSQIIDYNEC